MNKSLLSFLFFVPLLALICSGCNDGSGDQSDQKKNLLSGPLFASLTDSIHRFPNDAALYLRRAQLLSQNNAPQIAYDDYKKSWSLNPIQEAGLPFAANLAILGKTAERLELLRDCMQKFPENPEFKRLAGEAYIEEGKSKMALELYNNMLKKDSSDFESWYEKGLLLEQLQDTLEAIAALKKAYQLQPVNTYALELAHVYAESKNSLALKLCDEVISRDSSREMTDPFFIKGIYYSNTMQYNKAIVQFDSCISRDWKFTEAYIEKGVAFFKQKNYDEALNTFRMAGTVSNTDADAYYWMGRCYEAVNKKEEAIICYEKALGLDRNFDEARQALKRVKG